MRNFIATLKAAALTILVFLMAALILPQSRDLILGSLSFLWEIVKVFFLEDLLGKIIILAIITVTGCFVSLRYREKQRMWLILTALADLFSGLLLFCK